MTSSLYSPAALKAAIRQAVKLKLIPPEHMDISPVVLDGAIAQCEQRLGKPLELHLYEKISHEIEALQNSILSEALRREAFSGEQSL